MTIPDVYNTSGDCSYNNNQQRLNISFFNNTWSFSVIIKKDTENLGEEMMPYFWSEIDFNYIVTEELFPDVLPDLIGEWSISSLMHQLFVTTSPHMLRKVPGSIVCNILAFISKIVCEFQVLGNLNSCK